MRSVRQTLGQFQTPFFFPLPPGGRVAEAGLSPEILWGGKIEDRGGREWGVLVSAAGHLAFHMDAVISEESRSLNLLLSWKLKRALSGLKRT